MLKTIDIITSVLLIIGGLNWGLVGFFNTNLVTAIVGDNIIARLIFAIVGLAALYELAMFKGIVKRWHIQIHPTANA